MNRSKEFIKGLVEPYVNYEGILSCYNLEKKPHFANMGFIFNENFDIIIRPFKSTESYKLVTLSKKAVINIINDAKIFYLVTYEKDSINELIGISEKLKLPCFKNAYFYIECELKEILDDEIRPSLILEPVHHFAKKTFIKPYTRAEFALIESLIHSTRVRIFKEEKMYTELENLISLIDHYTRLVNRIAPKSSYMEIMKKINKIVEGELKYEKNTN
jgi:Uncharacterized conserved protein